MEGVTLKLAESAFCKWRAERDNKSERIPEYLWAMVLSLYPHYKGSIICKQLGLSGSQFKRRLIAHDSNPSTNDGFVLASRAKDEVSVMPNQTIQLTIQGSVRALTMDIEVLSLREILPHLGQLL